MRELVDNMNQKNVRMRHPSLLLAIRETLYWYLLQIGFKQYNPNKPAWYGLLHRSPCKFFNTLHLLKLMLYWYYITGTDKHSKYLTNELPAYCNLQGINISMYWYFTSVSLETRALKKNIKGHPERIKISCW